MIEDPSGSFNQGKRIKKLREGITEEMDKAFRNAIGNALTFPALFEVILKIRETDPKFCPNEIIEEIHRLESEMVPDMGKYDFYFLKITTDYGLRSKVMKLVRELPVKPLPPPEPKSEIRQGYDSDLGNTNFLDGKNL